MSDSRHTEDYPLKPTDADLDDESLDAQDPAGRPEGSGRAPDQAETGVSPDEPAPPMIRGWTPADDASISALRFNLREWQDRARDMERERDDLIESRDLLLGYVKGKPIEGIVRGFFVTTTLATGEDA